MKKSNNGLKSFFKGLAGDLWVLLLDVIAVNAAYYLVLMLRYYVNGAMDPRAQNHLAAFLRFAPIYTVLCLIVFAVCRLYNGMWRYAGVNDMNRILTASVITSVMQVGGTIIMGHTMPRSYYIGGALIQFLLIVLIRFAYRFVLVEQKKIASRKLPARFARR